ncbi:MAG: hypothetical protein RLZZ308_286 [Candidatus Parcubacteria bacterium]|jgi:hypothetical protein
MTATSIVKKIASASLLVTALSVQSAFALTVSPAREELTGDKGETITKTFTVINEQDTDQVLYTSVEAFDAQGETGTPNFIQAQEGLSTWVTIAEKVVIKKGERLAVPYTVTIPQEAESGGHFAAIFLSTVPPSAEEGQVSVGSKIGMLILLRVTGDIKESGGLSSFATKDGDKVFTSLPVDFVYKFNNTGNDRAKPEGSVVITNMFGGDVANINANPSQGNVLPGSTRKFEFRLGDVDAPAVSAPFFDHVKFQMKHFALGMYTADLGLTFGNSGTANASLTYFIFPWHLITVVLVAVLLVIVLLMILVKRYNRWIIKQARAAAKE